MRTVSIRRVQVCGRVCERFPVVLRDDGSALLEVMRFLMHLFGSGLSEAGLTTYAAHLRDFHEQLLADNRAHGDVCAAYINAYHSAIKARASTQYAAQVLRTVLKFLEYLERCGAVCGVIGESSGYRIQITRKGGGGLSHHLTKGSQSPKSNYYPSDSSIEAVKVHGPSSPNLNERFDLMIDWGNVRGLRAKEICGLTCAQLPDMVSIERALEDDRCLEVTLTVTKGGRSRKLEVHPILLAKTKKWIDTGRQLLSRRVSKRARARGLPIPKSDAIFLSETTGEALTPKAFSNAVRAAFKRAVSAGDLTMSERVWAHGLRKRMINRELQARPVSDYNRGAHELMQQTGHASLDTLGRYVADPL